jgi:hypothetical protein
VTAEWVLFITGFRLELPMDVRFLYVYVDFLFIYLLSVDSVTQAYIKPISAMIGELGIGKDVGHPYCLICNNFMEYT